MRLFSVIVLAALLGCMPASDEVATDQGFDLSSGWELRQVGTEDWFDAKVPGSVQQDLIDHELLSNPLSDSAELDNVWIENHDWEYQRTILLAELPNNENITLSFKGLDTYAKIYLNDSMLLEANNMFRQWDLELKRTDFQKENALRIVFQSPIAAGKEAEQRLGCPLPSPNDAGSEKVSSFLRKAPYQFGWDWGPRNVTSGIWKAPELIGWDDYRLVNIRVQHNSLTVDSAFGQVYFTIQSNGRQNASLSIDIEGQKFQTNTQLQDGRNNVALPFAFSSPELWWPNGWGEQRLYSLKANMDSKPGSEGFCEKKIGFRTIELRQEKDSIGTSFEFIVNGEPLFAKGANYIPQSVFPAAVDSKQYRQLLTDAKSSNFNMLRVWGGGIYEHDLFYELCDSLGLLVWQDFMFACALYPADAKYLANVKAETQQQVGRLSSHPSIALWCGNNEVDVAWKNWGWQSQFEYSEAQQKAIETGYDQLFKETLAEAVAQSAPATAYIHTSPLSNWGTDENFNHHNMHYWGVWHGTDDFDGFDQHVPRFMSEYGFQSFPSPDAFKGQLQPSNLQKENPLLAKRQKSYKTTGELVRHLEQHYPNNSDYASFAYLSQLNQRLAMQIAIDAHRKNRTRCAGTLYWQFNDVWAGPTWSTIDYAGTWKAAHYMVRERYKQLVVIPELTETELHIFVANDQLKKEALECRITTMTFEGDTVYSDAFEFSAKANSSALINEKDLNTLLPDYAMRNQTLAIIELFRDGALADQQILYFAEPKDLKLKNEDPKAVFTTEGDKTTIRLTSTTFIKDIYFNADVPGQWSNNFVDLLPNTTMELEFTNEKGGESARKFDILTLNYLLSQSNQ